MAAIAAPGLPAFDPREWIRTMSEDSAVSSEEALRADVVTREYGTRHAET